MQIHEVRTLYDYNYWANKRILSQAKHVTPEQFVNARFGYANLQSTLVHVLWAEWHWRLRWQGTSTAIVFDASDFPTLDILCARWDQEQQAMYAFIDTLNDEMLSKPISYTNRSGINYRHVLWQLMTHVVNHGTQHRSELAMLLTELGHSPGDIDIITFMRQ